jgi:hypothetical protein
VRIEDPVAGFWYTHDTHNRVAHRLPSQWFSEVGLLVPPSPPPAATAGIPSAGGRVAGSSFELKALSASDGARPGIHSATESLGTQEIEGLTVEGRRTTVTVAIGAQGNDKPLVFVNETWFSPQLRVAVFSKDTDPRSGENTTKLTKINLSEPDAALFEIPPGYTIVDDRMTTGGFR